MDFAESKALFKLHSGNGRVNLHAQRRFADPDELGLFQQRTLGGRLFREPERQQRPGQSIFHLGPERDHSIFAETGVRFAPLEEADYVVCSGLFNDEVETPEDYRELLGRMRQRSLFMVCGNPDVVVERGDKLVYCAGAIADLYVSLGGDVLYAGKPYRPIYADALKRAEDARGRPVPLARVLAIGDSLRTDVKGAAGFGIDCLFVTAGIHAEELGARDNPSADALDRIFATAGVRPTAVTQRLVW